MTPSPPKNDKSKRQQQKRVVPVVHPPAAAVSKTDEQEDAAITDDDDERTTRAEATASVDGTKSITQKQGDQVIVPTEETSTRQWRWRGCLACRRTTTTRAPIFGGNPEAVGWCYDVVGRTLSILSIGAFLMPALLTLAYEAAGCDTSQVQKQDCEGTVYGIKPSSLLTLVHTVVSVGAAPLMPVFGAVVDYTPHRLRIGRIVSLLFVALFFPQIFVGERTW